MNKSFEETIAEKITEQLNSDTLSNIIAEQINDQIKASINRIFSYSGDGRELIDKKLKEVMLPVIETHNFNDYLVKLDTALTEIVNNTNLVENKTILENFAALMKEPDSKIITGETLFEKYCDYVAEYVDTSSLDAFSDRDEPYYESVTAEMNLNIEESRFQSNYEHATLEFTCKEDEKLNIRIRLYKSKKSTDNVWSILDSLEPTDIHSLRTLSDFDILLLRLNRAFAKIEIDDEYLEDDDIEPKEKPEWTLN